VVLPGDAGARQRHGGLLGSDDFDLLSWRRRGGCLVPRAGIRVLAAVAGRGPLLVRGCPALRDPAPDLGAYGRGAVSVPAVGGILHPGGIGGRAARGAAAPGGAGGGSRPDRRLS